MNRQKAYSYFTHTFDLDGGSNGYYYFVNPFDAGAVAAGRKKMCVNFAYGKVKCWLTGYRGSIMDFIKEYEDIDYKVAKEMIEDYDETAIDLSVKSLTTLERKEVVMPKGFVSIAEGSGVLGKRARRFLTKRGFDIDKLDEEGFGYCTEEDKQNFKESFYGYIIIPFKKDGVLKYFIGRDFLNRDLKYKYKNPATEKFGIGKSQIIYNEDALDVEEEVYVMEGWSDAATIGDDGVAILGWDLSDYQLEQLLMSNVKSLVFLHDYGFREETIKAAMKFIGLKDIYVPDLDPIMSEDCKDINDLGSTPEGKELLLKQIADTKELLTRSKAISILSK